MREPVKRRRYDSPRRREQAAETRRAILLAARDLFERQGYAGTSVAAVAAGAGVAVKTVYLAFGTKSGVLRGLWNLLLRGDEGDAPVAERSWYREVLDERDPTRQLRLNARNARAVKLRIAPVLEVVRAAAASDADIASLWERIQSDFHANQGAVVESLAAKGALAPGLGVERATDILWALNHPDVWQLLVGRRGWSADEWERWFADAAAAQLLRGIG